MQKGSVLLALPGQLFESVTEGKGTDCLTLAVDMYSQIQMPHMDTFHCQACLTRSQATHQQQLFREHACHDYASVTSEL